MEHEIEWNEPPPDRRWATTSEYDPQEWVRRRCEGETLVSIGNDHNVSRERVRQVTEAVAPHKPWDAIKAERRRLRAEAAHVRRTTRKADCKTCGEGVFGAKTVYCSTKCLKVAEALRWATDEDEWLKHRKAVSRYHVAHAEKYDEHLVNSAKRILNDEIIEDNHGRWFIEGSQNFEYALMAAQNGWPIFERLHPDLKRQITTVISERETQ